MDLEFEFAGASYPRSTYPSIFLFLVDGVLVFWGRDAFAPS